MPIRNIEMPADRGQLVTFDASFSTSSIYLVSTDGLSVDICEQKLDVPLHKTYPLDDAEIEKADFSIAFEHDEGIVGFATAKYEDWNRRVNITGIYVRPEHRGRGIGKALLDAVHGYAQTTPARCLWLETQNVNYPAIRFYRKHGFTFCGFDTTLYDPEKMETPEVAFYFYREI